MTILNHDGGWANMMNISPRKPACRSAGYNTWKRIHTIVYALQNFSHVAGRCCAAMIQPIHHLATRQLCFGFNFARKCPLQ